MTVARPPVAPPAASKARRSERHEVVSTALGAALEMPSSAALAMAMAEVPPPDFQARQDAISTVRRSPERRLAPKLRATRARPSDVEETELNL